MSLRLSVLLYVWMGGSWAATGGDLPPLEMVKVAGPDSHFSRAAADGHHMIFARDSGLYLVSADRPGESRLLLDKSSLNALSLSPDGRRFAYISRDSDSFRYTTVSGAETEILLTRFPLN